MTHAPSARPATPNPGTIAAALLLTAFPSTAAGQTFGREDVALSTLPNLRHALAYDADSDGDMDLVLAGSSTSATTPTLLWCENLEGSGLASARALVPPGQSVDLLELAAADMDGDGDEDLVFRGNGPIVFGWFERTGPQTFALPRSIGAYTTAPSSFVAGDVDGDGLADLATMPSLGSVTLHRGLGGGAFAPEQVIAPTSNLVGNILRADLDGDGDRDLVWLDNAARRVEWIENLGAGSLAPKAFLLDFTMDFTSLYAEDLDGDGDVDLVASKPYSIPSWSLSPIWFENLGALSFGPPTDTGLGDHLNLAFHDLNADGLPEALASRLSGAPVTWHENLGGSFAGASALSGQNYWSGAFVVADFDGGGVDVAVGRGTPVELFTQAQSGPGTSFEDGRRLTIDPTRAVAADSGDLDGDGRAEVVLASIDARHSVVVVSSATHATWRAPVAVFERANPEQVQCVDLDGDGDLDILGSGGSFSAITAWVTWAENLGDGTFGAGFNLHGDIADSAARSSYGDMDGDGDLDVLWTHLRGLTFTRRYGWSEQVSPGTFAAGPAPPDGSLFGVLELGDVDADGDADLVEWQGAGSARLQWRANDGLGAFGPETILRPSSMPALTDVDVVDLDADGRDDVVVAGPFGVEWYRAQAAGGFAATSTIEPATQTSTVVRVADVDGDGLPDLLVSSDGAPARWIANLGGGAFAAPVPLAEPQVGSVALALGDVDGDTDPDVLKRRPDGGLAWNRGVERIGEAFCGPALPNSTGAFGVASASGFVAVAADDVTLHADRLPATSFGYFLLSRSRGYLAPAGQAQGAVCLSGAIGRLNRGPGEVFLTDAQGSASVALDLANVPTPTGATAILPGDTWHFQAWHRDANPAPTSNLTSGSTLEFR